MYILILDTLLFLGLTILIGHWKKRGELTKQRFAFFFASFISFLCLTMIFASPTVSWQKVGVLSTIALGSFIFCYLLGKWVYRIIYPDRE
jgi:hypothetical protein